MTTPNEVIDRLRKELTAPTFNELIPMLNGNAVHLDHLRCFFMVADYWHEVQAKHNSADALYNVAVKYDCSPQTVRYHVNQNLKRLNKKNIEPR